MSNAPLRKEWCFKKGLTPLKSVLKKETVYQRQEKQMIRMWKYLKKEKSRETQAEKDLRKKYNEFLSVLFENEHSLDLMTRLEEKLYNNQLISFPYLKGMICNLSKHVANIVESLIQLSGGEHVVLREIYGQLDKQTRQVLTGRKEPIYTPIIIPLVCDQKRTGG